jgi:hypothetical protein
MYPHERSLVSRLENEPFALVGVNSDPVPDYLEAIEREEITWPQFWDGGDTDGPISTKWGVRGWPTIYILDHEGIIREKNKREEKLDEVVDRLLAEMKEAEGPAED